MFDFNRLKKYLCMYVCMYICMTHTCHGRLVEAVEQLAGVSSPLLLFGSGGSNQAIRSERKHIFSLSCITGSNFLFLGDLSACPHICPCCLTLLLSPSLSVSYPLSLLFSFRHLSGVRVKFISTQAQSGSSAHLVTMSSLVP